MSKLTSTIYRAIIFIYKLIPFKRFFCFLIKASKIPNDKFYKDFKFSGKFKVKIEDRSFYLNHYGGTIENETFWKGIFQTWENDMGWIWTQFCKNSDVIIDIGANTGIYSLVSKCLNPGSAVYSFEPSINTYQKLDRNIRLNNYNIQSEQLAISNINGQQIFYDVPDENQSSASLSPEKLKNWEEYHGEIIEYNVRTMKLSEYIKFSKIDKIDLIKIDVESFEPEVMEGMEEYLLKFKPVIFIEVICEDVVQRLNKLIGDEFIRIHLRGNGLYNVVKEFSLCTGEWNYVFFHKDLSDKVRKQTNLIF